MVAKENEDKIERKREMVILNAAAANATNFFSHSFLQLYITSFYTQNSQMHNSQEKVFEISFKNTPFHFIALRFSTVSLTIRVTLDYTL